MNNDIVQKGSDFEVMPEKKVKIKPLSDKVIVKRDSKEEKTAGGIIVPGNAGDKPTRGTVVACNEFYYSVDGKEQRIDLKPGDIVIFGKWSGHEVKQDGETLLIMKYSDIIGVIDDER